MLFVGRTDNKMDRKGRVSVPASFRAALTGQSFHGIIAYPAFDGTPVIEACGVDWLEQLSARLNTLNPFSTEHRTLATAIFGRSVQIPFDGEGRVVLPRALIAHARIDELATFIGLGNKFQIWEPKAFEAFEKRVLEQAPKDSAVLGPLRPGDDGSP